MPKRHGLMRRPEPPWNGGLWFLTGIHSVFGAVVCTNLVQNDDERKKAQSLEWHFRELVRRLAHALDLFQRTLAECEQNLNTPLGEWHINSLSGGSQVKAGILADSIMAYISILADDVGKLIPFVFDGRERRAADSLGKIKKEAKGERYVPIRALLAELDNVGTWWALALGYGTGLRQKLVHYTDTFHIVGSRPTDEERFKLECSVWEPMTGGQPVDFIESLRMSLHGLCDWLDRLEQVLQVHVASQASARRMGWQPDPVCPSISVPIDTPLGEREIPDGFLYLPLCDGSLPTRFCFRTSVQGSDLHE
jgi:hypothetical protein